MSALGNGSMKKSEKKNTPSIYDIGSATGIVIGRGYEDQVAAQTTQQMYLPAPMAMSVPEDTASMEELDQFIEESSLTEKDKEATRAILHDELLIELQNGEQANVMVVKRQLTEITTNLPGIRIYLRSFIENYAGVSKTIRLLTRGLLE